MSGLMTAEYKRQMVNPAPSPGMCGGLLGDAAVGGTRCVQVSMSHQGKIDIEGNPMLSPVIYGPHIKARPTRQTPEPNSAGTHPR